MEFFEPIRKGFHILIHFYEFIFKVSPFHIFWIFSFFFIALLSFPPYWNLIFLVDLGSWEFLLFFDFFIRRKGVFEWANWNLALPQIACEKFPKFLRLDAFLLMNTTSALFNTGRTPLNLGGSENMPSRSWLSTIWLRTNRYIKAWGSSV